MKSLVRQAMQDGAVGLSTALQYAPAPYATTEELIALAAEAANSAASTPPICAAKATPSTQRSTKLPDRPRSQNSGRDLAPQSGWQTQLGPHARNRRRNRECPRMRALMSRPILTHTRLGSTRSPHSFRPGFMTAAMRRWWRASRIPLTRARIRKQMETDSSGWDNEWLEIPGPEAILVSVVA